jgi:SagB-type dehydrogenase family enzyme
VIRIRDGDRRRDLYHVTLDQDAVADAALVIVFAAVFERTTAKYGERGRRYVEMEAGHAAQNVCLQAVSLELGVVPIGAFDDSGVKKVVACEAAETPLYLLAIGAVS